MKIFCIGRNYANHAKELGNVVPKSPIIFMKPPSALLINNKPLYYPAFTKDLHYEVEVVVKIGKNGRHVQPEFARSYVEAIGLGIDFTARDIQKDLKSKGHPWELAKGFDHSAAISQFFPIDQFDIDKGIQFSLQQNEKVVQNGNTKQMIFDIDFLICFISAYFRLQKGDMIYTGTPEGVGPVSIDDQLIGTLENQEVLYCEIK